MFGVLGQDDGDAQTVGAELGTKGLSWRALAFFDFCPFAPKDGVGTRCREQGRVCDLGGSELGNQKE